MGEAKTGLISQQTCQALNRLFSGLSSEQAALVDHIQDEILSNISQYREMTNHGEPGKKVEAVFSKKAVHHSKDEQEVLKRALVAKLALQLPAFFEEMNLPASILTLYPDAFEHLADFLRSALNKPYESNSEFFNKDVRFVLGLSIPCGAFCVDMRSRVLPIGLIRSFIRIKDINKIIRYVRAKGNGTWSRGHLDERYLAEFNERGNHSFLLRIAELLALHEDMRGHVATSWYFDPQLLQISPNLAFLIKLPLENGAFLLRHGSRSSIIEQALRTSEKRRRLYQEGKYIPVSYSRLWPRKELLAWAEQAKQVRCL